MNLGTLKKWLGRLGIGAVVLLIVIQFIPYGRAHANPAVVQEPQWDSEVTRDLAVRACYDCHSNETEWPWYSNVAPLSWVVENHVDEGRQILNFSDWTRSYRRAHESAETIQEGQMPPLYFTVMHSKARLSDQEKQQLIEGLNATVGSGG
jgi:hypothetical protein